MVRHHDTIWLVNVTSVSWEIWNAARKQNINKILHNSMNRNHKQANNDIYRLKDTSPHRINQVSIRVIFRFNTGSKLSSIKILNFTIDYTKLLQRKTNNVQALIQAFPADALKTLGLTVVFKTYCFLYSFFSVTVNF